MTHRHFGLPGTKPRDTYTSPSRPGSLSATAFMSGIVVIMIALGVILYGVSKTITDAANTATSAPRTTGEGGGTQTVAAWDYCDPLVREPRSSGNLKFCHPNEARLRVNEPTT